MYSFIELDYEMNNNFDNKKTCKREIEMEKELILNESKTHWEEKMSSNLTQKNCNIYTLGFRGLK